MTGFHSSSFRGSAKSLEKGTLSAKSRIQESKRAVIGESGRKLFVLASWRIRRLEGFRDCGSPRWTKMQPRGKVSGGSPEAAVEQSVFGKVILVATNRNSNQLKQEGRESQFPTVLTPQICLPFDSLTFPLSLFFFSL